MVKRPVADDVPVATLTHFPPTLFSRVTREPAAARPLAVIRPAVFFTSNVGAVGVDSATVEAVGAAVDPDWALTSSFPY
ncbi:MAG: hypothetical protein ACKO1X_04510 [Acidimicrobiales bacterium]